jgi:diguanylate cyclase (GGDEF)-like protein/PAS domain S-box-containing protein
MNLQLAVLLGLLVLLYGALSLIVRNGQRIIDREKQERMQAETALAESESRFRSLTEMSSDFYWETDTEHRIALRTASNADAGKSVFHQTSPLGLRRWEIPYVSPDKEAWENHRAMLDVHLPFRDFEISRRANDGTVRHVSLSGDPVFDASGKFKGYRGVGADITGRKRAEAALQSSEARFRSLTALSSDWYWEQDQEFRFVDASSGLRERTGNDEHLGKTRWELPSVGVAAERWAGHRADLEAHRPFHNFEYALRGSNGALIHMSVSGMPIFDEHGAFKGYRGAGRDITRRKLAEASLRIAATAFEAQEGMVVTDANSVILRVNSAFTEITGYSAAEVMGQTPRMLRSGRHDEAFFRAMWDSLLSSGIWKGEIWNRRKSGEVYPEWLTVTAVRDGGGSITNYVATLTDITGRKAAEEEIRNLAFYDPLTQLPNRRLLMDRLHQALASSERSRRRGALLFIDLDHFKSLNDTLGHDKGDLLLQQVAQRLTACVREADTVARLGGDEFVVMLEELSERADEAEAQTRAIAEKILATFSQPYLLAGHPHQNSGSIGIAPFCGHDQSATALLKHADIAMYQAKAGGRNALRFFEPGMQAEIPAAAQDAPAPKTAA